MTVVVPFSADCTGTGASCVPEGGLDGQVLAKASDANFDVEWVDMTGGVGPPGPPGPEGTLDVIELTQAEYDALAPKIPNTIYVIT